MSITTRESSPNSHRIYLALFALALALIVGETRAADWKVGNVSPETVSWGKITQYFSKELTERSGGAITANNFPSMQLGNNTELAEGVRAGVIQVANVGVPQLSNFYAPLAALQLPFLFDDFEHIIEFFTSDYMRERLDDLEALNMKGLAWFSTDGRNFLTKDGFIDSPADVEGLKIRVAKNELAEDSMRALGVNPVSISFGEVYTAMQTGVVDALVFDNQTIASMHYHELAKYVSEVNLWPFPGVLVMNLDLWNSLSDEHKQLVRDVASDTEAYYYEIARNETGELATTLSEKHGVMRKSIDVERFRDATKDVYSKYMDRDPLIKEIAERAIELR